MFYRPHFCCHCGEKIIRARWTPLTSRRFCDFCAIEQKQHDLIPRAAAIVIILFGAAGITAYLSNGRNSSAPGHETSSAKSRDLKAVKTPGADNQETANKDRANPSNQIANEAEPALLQGDNANTKQRGTQRNSSTEPVYHCGALTKKGTSCTRRVKIEGRCWQHLGQPAASSQRN